MKHLCAWCRQPIAPDSDPDKDTTTHGICMTCVDNYFGVENKEITDFLAELDAPVLLIDEAGKVLAGNPAALCLYKKDPAGLAGKNPGDVTDCVFSKMPEGCAKTVHCTGCAIRKAINDTQRTGQSQRDVPAYQDVVAQGCASRMHYLISTQFVNGIILLRIDRQTPAA